MALTRTEVPILWAAARSKSVVAGATEPSDILTPDATCFGMSIALKAKNDGAPADGDIVTFYAAVSNGDPDGAAADEYPADVADMDLLAVIDTFNNTDPGLQTAVLVDVPHRAKIYAVSGAATNGITVSGIAVERRG